MGVIAALVLESACALIDGELFLLEHWFVDQEHCREAGMPEFLKWLLCPKSGKSHANNASNLSIKCDVLLLVDVFCLATCEIVTLECLLYQRLVTINIAVCLSGCDWVTAFTRQD